MAWLWTNSQATCKATNGEIKNCDTLWILPKEATNVDFLSVPLRLNTYLHWTIWWIHMGVQCKQVWLYTNFVSLRACIVIGRHGIVLYWVKGNDNLPAWKLKWNGQKFFKWNLEHKVQRSSAIKPPSLCNHSIYPYCHHQIKFQSMMVDEIGEVESTPGLGI